MALVPTAHASYRVNIHSEDLRVHRYPNSVKFCAASDAAAEAIAAVFMAAVSGQQTSVTKRLYEDDGAVPYPTGTRLTAQVVLKDAAGVPWRQSIRNFKAAYAADWLTQLFMGGESGDAAVSILSATPSLPNTTNAVVTVTQTIIGKE